MARKLKVDDEDEIRPVISSPDNLIELTANLVSAYVSRNQVPMAELPGLIAMFHTSLRQAASGSAPADMERKPAVPVKKSVAEEFIVCLEDVGSAPRLSDGRAGLRPTAICLCQENRPWPRSRRRPGTPLQGRLKRSVASRA